MALKSELSTVVEAEMASVRVARRFVQSVLSELVPTDITSDLMLATSELVSNAVEYGSGSAIAVAVKVTDLEASVTVTSATTDQSLAPVEEWKVAGVDSLSGRGLGIVRAVADDVDVDRDNGGLSITLRRRLRAV